MSNCSNRHQSAKLGRSETKQKFYDADFIKKSITPLDFYRYELPNALFKKRTWNNGGLCPFHTDRNAGSFFVNLETGAFTCHSCGTKGGDVIAFTMSLYGLNLPEALEQLTIDWGL